MGRDRATRFAGPRALTPLSEAQAERYRRKFLQNRRAHTSCLVWAIVFGALVVIDTVVIVVMVKTPGALVWPWLLGWVVGASLAVHFFVKQGTTETCPRCRGHLLGFKEHCPWCGSGIGEDDRSCRACHRVLDFEGKGLKEVGHCTSCGLDLVGAKARGEPVAEPGEEPGTQL